LGYYLKRNLPWGFLGKSGRRRVPFGREREIWQATFGDKVESPLYNAGEFLEEAHFYGWEQLLGKLW